MIACTGIGINEFIAVGRAKIVQNRTDEDYPKTADDPKGEKKRLENATDKALKQLQKLHDKTENSTSVNII